MASHDPTPLGSPDGPRSPDEHPLADASRPREAPVPPPLPQVLPVDENARTVDEDPETWLLKRPSQSGGHSGGYSGDAGTAGSIAGGPGADGPGVDAGSVDCAFLPYSVRPRLRHLLVTFLFHHNPFYLLSALCMIAGCYVLNAGLELRTGEVHRVLLLIGTLAVYELMLVGLGLFLIRGRGLTRDGRTLLLLQVVFLVDLTFLNAETVTADLRVGLAVNAVLLVLAWLKVGAVLRVLSPGRFPARAFGMAALMLTALFALPCWLRLVERDGRVAGDLFHLTWWAVGLLPVACEVLRHAGRRASAGPLPAGLRPRLGGVYVALGFASVVAHLAMMHWVYRGRFYLADLTPVLLGLAVAAAYGSPTRAVPRGDLAFLRLALPAMAVLCAIAGPRPMDLSVGAGGRFDVRSVHLALAGAYAVYAYAYLWRHVGRVAVATAAAALVVLFGPTVAQVRAFTDLAWARAIQAGWAILPKTMVQWGVTAVGAAFAFLGIGALLSLSQGKQPAAAMEDEAPAVDAGG